MKRLFTIMIAVMLSSLLASGCGSSRNSDAKSIIIKQATVTEQYVNGLEKAKSADDVVVAVNRYTEGMKELIPMILEFEKKYPDYKTKGVAPAGMEKETARLESISAKMQPAMMKTMRYMYNPKVQKAMQNMGQELQKIQRQH